MPKILEMTAFGFADPYMKIVNRYRKQFKLDVKTFRGEIIAEKQYDWSKKARALKIKSSDHLAYRIWAVACMQALFEELCTGKYLNFSSSEYYTGDMSDLREQLIEFPELVVAFKFIIAIHKYVFKHVHRNDEKIYTIENSERVEANLIMAGLKRISENPKLLRDFQELLKLPRI